MKFSSSAPVASAPVSSLSMPSLSSAPAMRRAAAPKIAAKIAPPKDADAANNRGGDAPPKTPKKRVRLKPETPEQLIERLRNPQLSLHEASILLRVSRATVRRYADSGRLNCQRTPGGQRRFFLRDIENFYRQLKLKR